MQFRAEQYYQVSLERMEQARRIYQGGRAFALAMYCAGLAVEALLRAFRWMKDPSFEGRHDLAELFRESRMFSMDDEHLRQKGATDAVIQDLAKPLRVAMNEVIALWHNNLRFASEASLRAHLNKLGRLREAKGNPLKKNALDLLNAAQTGPDRDRPWSCYMDLKTKIMKSLREGLKPDYMRLEDDEGLSGFVVTGQFRGVSALERQEKIDDVLANSLSAAERRRVLMIAGLTPEEYDLVGARIRVHDIRETARGAIEVILHGGPSDAEYIRGVLGNQKNIETTEPKSVPRATGLLMYFRAKGIPASPLTKERVTRVLKEDPYIEVAANGR